MSEICTKIETLKEGQSYTADAGDCLITEDHTISDIARWINENEWNEEMVYLLKDLEQQTSPS